MSENIYRLAFIGSVLAMAGYYFLVAPLIF